MRLIDHITFLLLSLIKKALGIVSPSKYWWLVPNGKRGEANEREQIQMDTGM